MPHCQVSHELAGPASIYYELHGEGPIRVCLVMGFGTSLEGWRMQVDHFLPKANEFTVLVLDNRGCGRSSVPHWVSSVETMARDLICVLEQIGWHSGVHLCGISMGGMISLEAALHSHAMFDSLTLINTHAGGVGAFPQLKGLRHFAAVFTAPNVRARTEHALRLLYGSRALDSPEKVEALRLALRQRYGKSPPTSPKGLFNHFTAVSTHWISAKRLRRLGGSGLPILIVVGDEDNLLRPSNSYAIHAAIGTSKLRVFEGCGHGLIAEVPDEFNAELEKHIRDARERALRHGKGAPSENGSIGVVVRPIVPVVDGERLSGLDSLFLVAEAPQQGMAISGFCVLDKEIPREAIVATFDHWTRQYPRLRQKLGQRTLLRPWYRWESDPSFDVGAHVHVHRLPAGESAQARISKIVSEPLDQSKPLWDTNLIIPVNGEGVPNGGACVLLTRLHHAIADGSGSVQMMLSLCGENVALPHPQTQQTTRAAENGHSHGAPNASGARRNSLVAGAVSFFNALLALLWTLLYYPAMVLYWAVAALIIGFKVTVLYLGPGSPFKTSAPGSTEKRVAWTPALDLAEVKRVGRRMGVSVNDVLLSCIAGAFGRVKTPSYTSKEAVCMIPFNMRPRLGVKGLPAASNNLSITVWCSLPIGETNVVARTIAIKRRMDSLKRSPEAVVSMWFTTFLGYMPSWVARFAVAPLGAKAAAVVTNVPGPQHAMHIAGEKLKNYTGIIPVTGDAGLGMTIFSYDGKVTVSAQGSSALTPSVDAICAAIAGEFEALREASERLEAPVSPRDN